VKIAVVRETLEHEARVALIPELVAKLVAEGHEVAVDPGAGDAAQFADEVYAEAGASIGPDGLRQADLTLSVQPLVTDQIWALRSGSATISFLPPAQSLDKVSNLRDCDDNASIDWAREMRGTSSSEKAVIPQSRRFETLSRL